jgi:hypothetical protein
MGLSEAQLESTRRKLARGVEHVKTLRAEIEAYENGLAYRFEWDTDRRSATQIEYRCFAVEGEWMPDHWPLLAGEAIQNLRSSLDHFVFAASGCQDHTQFPILTDPLKFGRKARGMLPGIPPETRQSIERSQPYHEAPEAPTRVALEQLRMLSNLDKHRVLATFATAVVHEGVGVPDGARIEWEEYGSEKRLATGRTHVSTFVVHTDAPDVDVTVEPLFDYEVHIEGRPVAVLAWIAGQVFRVLAETGSGERLSPFAPYPI